MLTKLINKLVTDEKAASMVEYSLLVVLIAIVAFVAVQLAGDSVSGMYSTISDELVQAGS